MRSSWRFASFAINRKIWGQGHPGFIERRIDIGIIDIHPVYLVDARQGRSLPQPIFQFAQRRRFTAGKHFDSPVGKIPRITRKLEPQCLRARRSAKKHALHFSADEEFCGGHGITITV